MAMNSSSSSSLWNRAKPYVAVVFLRAGYAGMSLLGKNDLNHGLNNYSFFVYRQIIAAAVIAPFALVLERKVRPKMTLRLFAKILLLAFFPVMDQNLYFLGMKYTSATFAMALVNILPALTFVMAWVFRLETVNIKSIRSQAKIIGTVVTIGGAMVMTLVKGPIIPTPWNDSGKGGHGHAATNTLSTHDMIMGAILVTSGCTAGASFVIFQAMMAKSYQAPLSLTTWICSLGAVLGFMLALGMEWGNWAIWELHCDSTLLAVVYSGIICSGVGYYLQDVIMKAKGPVFVTAFSPLSMVIVAILSSFLLSEVLTFGSLIGAIVIVTGLYLVLWGKSKDKMATKNLVPESPLPPTFLPIESPKDLKNTTDVAVKEQPMDNSDTKIIVSTTGVERKDESV